MFAVGQSVSVSGLTPCSCASGHQISQASFRRVDSPGVVEVFTCRGSALVSVERVSAA